MICRRLLGSVIFFLDTLSLFIPDPFCCLGSAPRSALGLGSGAVLHAAAHDLLPSLLLSLCLVVWNYTQPKAPCSLNESLRGGKISLPGLPSSGW